MTSPPIKPEDYLSFLESVSPFLDSEFVKEASNFEHGQWELPFEATLLEIIKLDRENVIFDFILAKNLAQHSDIIHEGTIDPFTWNKLLHWECGNYQTKID